MYVNIESFKSVLTDTALAGATSISVDGASQICDALSGGGWTYLTISGGGQSEQVKVTGCSNGKLTVSRGVSGAPVNWAATACIEAKVTKEVIAECVIDAMKGQCWFHVDDDSLLELVDSDDPDCPKELKLGNYKPGNGITIIDDTISSNFCDSNAAPCLDDGTKMIVAYECDGKCVTGTVSFARLCSALAEKVTGTTTGGGTGSSGLVYEQGPGIKIAGQIVELKRLHSEGFGHCGVQYNEYGQAISTDPNFSCGTRVVGSASVDPYLMQGTVVDGVLVSVSPYDLTADLAGLVTDANNYTDAAIAAINTQVLTGVSGNCGITGSISGSTININMPQVFTAATKLNCWLSVDQCGRVTAADEMPFTWHWAGRKSDFTQLESMGGLIITNLGADIATMEFTSVQPANEHYQVIVRDDAGTVMPLTLRSSLGFAVDTTGSDDIVHITVIGRCSV